MDSNLLKTPPWKQGQLDLQNSHAQKTTASKQRPPAPWLNPDEEWWKTCHKQAPARLLQHVPCTPLVPEALCTFRAFMFSPVAHLNPELGLPQKPSANKGPRGGQCSLLLSLPSSISLSLSYTHSFIVCNPLPRLIFTAAGKLAVNALTSLGSYSSASNFTRAPVNTNTLNDNLTAQLFLLAPCYKRSDRYT